MRIDEFEEELRAAIAERKSGDLTGEVAWAAFIAVAREPVQPPLVDFHESFQLEASALGLQVVLSLRRRLDHRDEDGDEVDATTFHCELSFRIPQDPGDFDDVLLDEETDPRILDVGDLDRYGRDIRAIRQLLPTTVQLNVFADGLT